MHMDSLQDILGTKNFVPPDEMEVIKDYIRRKYKSGCVIRVEKSAVIVDVPSPTLAAVIHLERQQLIKACRLKKRLVVRGRR
jgi:predicted ATP-dependent Lon-type protease